MERGVTIAVSVATIISSVAGLVALINTTYWWSTKRRKRQFERKLDRVRSFGISVEILPRRSAEPRVPRVPRWAFRVMPSEDAERYVQEWEAHLWERIAQREFKEAKRDRRALILGAFLLCVVLRLKRAFARSRK